MVQKVNIQLACLLLLILHNILIKFGMSNQNSLCSQVVLANIIWSDSIVLECVSVMCVTSGWVGIINYGRQYNCIGHLANSVCIHCFTVYTTFPSSPSPISLIRERKTLIRGRIIVWTIAHTKALFWNISTCLPLWYVSTCLSIYGLPLKSDY